MKGTLVALVLQVTPVSFVLEINNFKPISGIFTDHFNFEIDMWRPSVSAFAQFLSSVFQNNSVLLLSTELYTPYHTILSTILNTILNWVLNTTLTTILNTSYHTAEYSRIEYWIPHWIVWHENNTQYTGNMYSGVRLSCMCLLLEYVACTFVVPHHAT